MSYAMDVEPLRLKNNFPPRSTDSTREAKHQGPRETTTNNVGGKPAFNYEDRKRMAMMTGSVEKIGRQFGVKDSTVYRYRQEFRKEREAAGIEALRGRPPKQIEDYLL